MKHLITLLTLIFLGVSSSFAQNKNKTLSVEEIGDGSDIYLTSGRHEAQLVFEVNDEFSLNFRSNLDDELDIEIDSVGNKKSYSIVLVTQEPGVSYASRVITILAPGFEDYDMPFNLKDREKHIFRVWDEYSKFTSPFFSYQEKANELFANGEYQSARDYYKLTRACPEYPSDSASINQHIADCDTLIELSLRAEEHERFAEWQEALDTYLSMMRLNNSNEAIRQRYNTCRESFYTDCEAEFRNGEHYMAQGSMSDLKKAMECFQRVLDKKCPTQAAEAAVNLRNVKRQMDKENDHSRCLFYDAGLNQYFGFTFSNCYNRENKRHGGYFTLRFNSEIIDFASKKGYVQGTFQGLDQLSNDASDITVITGNGSGNFKYSDDYEYNENKKEWAPKDHLDYEAQMTWGWTNQIYRWFYIHYGFGYHGGGFYTFDTGNFKEAVKNHEDYNISDWRNEKSWSKKFRNAYSSHDWYNGAAIELGLIVKVKRFCLKGTYQYTHWFSDKYEDFFDNQHHNVYVGVGFNW